MKDAAPQTIYLKDYREPDFRIRSVDLTFELGEETTQVTSRMHIERYGDPGAALELHGEALVLVSVQLDERTLDPTDYTVTDERLIVPGVPDRFELQCVTHIKPQDNTALEGLYKSNSMFCTQCEAEGFRKITYYLDRPDNLSVFTTTVSADRSRYPVLLSNGNCVARGEYSDGRHWCKWHDPHPKPSYLFALVAGDLAKVEDQFTTASGRCVDLAIYVEEKDLDKCDHAMDALKKAMRWDEDVYGREYDLDVYMIVAVDDFNMGAMENKGLNIFNTACVLANPKTTTDTGFQRVEGVVAHEYFHNWSGNRVTCRDWFQLSLKEGFTVFRDSCFSADMGSPTVKRVEDVQLLRTMQFAEDAGPMAHPVQPASFIEISNFYTLTVYEKGAEIVRMIHTILGPKDFRRGCDLYFDRHDGHAVTIEDFVQAMAEVSGRDFTQFLRWYKQAGTPELHVHSDYQPEAKCFRLHVTQHCPSTPEASAEDKTPLHIPLAVGLLGQQGALPLTLEGEVAGDGERHRVLDIRDKAQTFTFVGVEEPPVPSLLRDFSAPVKLFYDYNEEQLLRLMSMDDDGFCRWDAAQRLGLAAIQQAIEQPEGAINPHLLDGVDSLLKEPTLDPAMVALTMDLPSEAYVAEQQSPICVEQNHTARNRLRAQLAESLELLLLQRYEDCRRRLDRSDGIDADTIAQRSLMNKCLGFLMLLDNSDYLNLCLEQLQSAQNMTEELGALTALVNSPHERSRRAADSALNDFYQRWQHEPLVVNQWFQVQATRASPDALATVERLMAHEAFTLNNPNKVRSLIGAYANLNPIGFHRRDGAGYEFLAAQIIALNDSNPQVASRLVMPLTKWRRYDDQRQQLMKTALQRVAAVDHLSKDVFEIVDKSLGG